MALTAAPFGDAGVRCVVDSLADAHRLHAALTAAALPGVVNVVPAWRTVVVTVSDPRFVADLVSHVAALDLHATQAPAPRRHVLDVVYDGPDLQDVAAHCGITADDVVERHTARDYVVAFLGFSPGFPYLAGMDPALATPRLATPRPRVPAGSVGIADDVTGIYPADSPGGWRVIGRVGLALFDADREPPALFAPGDVVRFVAA